ncbi:ABC-type phosphate/phosphonate transport system, substrate-binding protein [Cupriavidus sp. YR651]|uniref:phosphate/phosphite/phosphonate ABC transporter substrate-binding protein n=1 Tax=Cupriavidus sp. YR651 TaxID=1855315 RepID=UPI0008814D93|nr:PhnD/SsuA/transferrin family substrate-binding protein [Cupriavidus sp. YR651]SDC71567.1 ABC-type phosphate/phosphonate transport system, substrate-binding protein [Cupriavidus sp. YR651]
MAKPERWVAALPMYNVSASLRDDWLALIDRVGQALARERESVILSAVDPGDGPDALHAFWRRDDMLLSQTCGYPLVNGLAQHVRLIGTPRFTVPGCHRKTYRSAIVVRASDGPGTLEACRGARAACNGPDSHSGMNALRHAVAPLAAGGRFFADIVSTGSHLGSLAAVESGEADVAAIDCVTLAFAAESYPHLVAGLRQIGFTRAVPGLPFVASRRAGSPLVGQVRECLREVLREDPGLRSRLRMEAVVRSTAADYFPIVAMAQEARLRGYGELA